MNARKKIRGGCVDSCCKKEVIVCRDLALDLFRISI